jgi:hypothetical protein
LFILSACGDRAKIEPILHRYNFHDLAECFQLWDRLIRWTEGKDARLCVALGTILQIADQFNGLAATRNLYASACREALIGRLIDTADDGQLLVAYLITGPGLDWFRGLPDTEPTPILPYSKSIVVTKVYRLLSHFRVIFGTDPSLFEGTWLNYLTTEQWIPGQRPEDFWRQRVGPWGWSRDAIGAQSWFALAQMALILIRLPCSEAAVERVFSHLRLVLGTRRQSMGEDLLDAILVVRWHETSTIQALNDRLESVEEGQEPERGHGTETQLGFQIQAQLPGELHHGPI